MSRSRFYFTAFVFCAFFLMAKAGTWLSFNQRAQNDLMPYIMNDKDLENFIRMCKEEANTARPILRHERKFAEMCVALEELLSGRRR